MELINRICFFNLYAFILLTSNIVPGINYFVVITHPLYQLQVRRRSSSSCYMIFVDIIKYHLSMSSSTSHGRCHFIPSPVAKS